jgi:hypothetical protein
LKPRRPRRARCTRGVCPSGRTRREGYGLPWRSSREDLVQRGLEDLAAGVESVESLLVSIGAPRLTGLGMTVDNPFPSPEHRLYMLLSEEEPASAHSRYNALISRLVSYESAAELRVRARTAPDRPSA